MKSIFKLFGLLLIGLSTSCTSSRNSSAKGYEPDDRYFSLADAKRERKQYQKLNNQPEQNYNSNQDATSNNSNIDGYNNTEPSTQNPNYNPNYNYTPAPQTNNGGGNVNNYYYNDLDDNYDFQYASRFRRFHNNWGNMGYYDPYMTNMFWYNYDPFMFGNSIYSTCNFFNPYTPWGWNSFGGGPGLNFGWNSWSGFYMNYGMGFNNPWAWNNPWRWNNWGYSPFNSPFSYNPWGYNPYGFGMNQFSMGYNNGFYNGLMMNQMMNNQMYFNSFDNNSLQPIITTPVGVNVGGGSVFKIAQPTLAEQFTKEIPNHSNPILGGKNQLSSPQVIQPAINSGVTKPVTGNNLTNTQPAIASPQNTLPVKDGKPSQSIAPEQVKPGTITQSKPVNSQQNKNDLINSGVNPNNNVAPTRSPINNYTSAPSNRPAQAQDPIRTNNLTPKTNTPVEYNNFNRPERPQPIISQPNTEVSPKNGSGNIVRDNNSINQQPAVNQQRNNYQQYQSPQNFNRPNNTEQTPLQRPNNQQYNNQQQDRFNQNNSNQQNRSNQNQQYQVPQQRNNYTEPRQERNNYSQPRQERNNYSQPRQEYQAPRQQPRESNRSGSDYSTPRQNSTPSNRSFESAPRNNSGGGSNRPSSGSGGGGSRMNSPRR